MNRRLALRMSSLGALAISSALASCTSTSGGTEKPAITGQPARVAYVSYGTGAVGQRLEIVNQSHTDRTELYSKARSIEEAVTKVTTDEVMDELLSFFRTKGFFEHAQQGSAPSSADGRYSQALEIEIPGDRRYMTVQKGIAPDERQRFFECAQAFVMIYNDTYQLQSVDRAPDWDPAAADRPASTKKSPDR